MNNRRLILAVAFFAFVIFSCKKDDSNPSPNFSAKINGIPYVASNTFCMLVVDSFLHFRAFTLQGYYQSKMLSVVFMDTVLTEEINSHTTDGGLGISIQYEDTLSNNWYNMISGNLDFSKFDNTTKKTSGTFSGTLVGNSPQETLHITDGRFTNVTYVWSHSN